MAGLLDGFGDFIKTPEGQGLLAATFGGLAGARSGAPINSIGRAGLAGMQGYSGAIDRQQQMAEAEQTKRARDVQMELYQAQAERAKAQAAKEQADAEQKARIAAGMGQFFKSGSPALAPLMGDESTGILPSKGRAAVAPSFDSAGAAAFLAQNGAYEDALKYLPKPKETPINKLDVKDFTPASVQKFAQSGDYADLVRMDKAQFQNTGGFTMALDPFTGKPLNQIQNTQSPDSKASTAVSWANFGLSKDRLNFDKSKAAAETANGGYSNKPLPATALKMQSEAVDAISTASGINDQLSKVGQQIKDGKLSFGPVSNLLSGARNSMGMSTEQSRNLASFRSTMEKLRNDSLRLNSGVQTDGDAQRAWNELFQNINDTELVQQRLTEITAINKRAEELQRLKVDQIRGNYNAPPMDFKPLLSVPSGATGSTSKTVNFGDLK